MWHATVLKADSAFGRPILDLLNACSHHPTVTVGFLALIPALALTMWAQMLELRLEAIRTLPARPIRTKR